MVFNPPEELSRPAIRPDGDLHQARLNLELHFSGWTVTCWTRGLSSVIIPLARRGLTNAVLGNRMEADEDRIEELTSGVASHETDFDFISTLVPRSLVFFNFSSGAWFCLPVVAFGARCNSDWFFPFTPPLSKSSNFPNRSRSMSSLLSVLSSSTSLPFCGVERFLYWRIASKPLLLPRLSALFTGCCAFWSVIVSQITPLTVLPGPSIFPSQVLCDWITILLPAVNTQKSHVTLCCFEHRLCWNKCRVVLVVVPVVETVK